jgi:hypothetical protein
MKGFKDHEMGLGFVFTTNVDWLWISSILLEPNITSILLIADLKVLEIQRPGVMTGPKVQSKTKKVS